MSVHRQYTSLDALPGAMLQIDGLGRIRDRNRAAVRIVSRLAIDESLIEWMDSQGAARLMAILADGEQPPWGWPEFEAIISERRFRLTVGPRLPDGARLVHLTDITEFRRLSRQLKESEQRYRSLFREHPDAAYSLSTDGHFREVNRRTTELTGYDYEQLLGQHWEAVVVEEDREATRDHLQGVLKGHPCCYRCRVQDQSGVVRVAQVTNVPMIVGGEVVGVFGIAQDITEHSRMAEQRRLLQASMTQIHDVILITETRPLDEPGPRIVFVNEAVERLTGYRPDELIGHSPRIFQGPATDAAALRRIREALETRRPSKEVLINYRKDGTAFWNELEIVPIAATSMTGCEYFAAVQRDISTRMRRESQLQQSQQALRRLYKAQESVREEERRRIARDLHDDLGQMLIAMKLDLGRVIQELPALPAPHTERLHEQMDFVDEVIEKVRETAANLRPAVLDDLGFEAAAEWFLDQCAHRYQLDIHWQLGAGVTGSAVGETATVLFRILQECLTNIHRHARASQVTVQYDEYDSQSRLEVRDDGIGFHPASMREQGFGLAGMRERVSMLGGALEVESSPGKGACVITTLPLEQG